MGFVETAFLGALGALAIPIVVHLIFRRRTERVDLGTIRFLRAVLEKHTKRRKVRRWSLLVLRLAAVALLALAFARPYLMARTAGALGGTSTVLLVDVSASTTLADANGRRTLDAAVDEARRILDEHGSGDVVLAVFDDGVRPVADLDDLKSVAAEPTFGGTNFAAAIDWARDVVVASNAARRTVHIVTDLQRAGLDFASAAGLPDDVELQVHDIGRDHANNVAVTAAQPLEPVVRPGESVTITATVHNAGAVALSDVPVTLLLEHEGRQRRDRRRVDLPADGGLDLAFEVEELDEGLWTGHVEVETANDLVFDDRRHLAILARPRWQVLVVDGDPGERTLLSESYFLETALRLAPPGSTYDGSPFTTTIVAATEENPFTGLDRGDLVVLANVETVAPAHAERLAEFVRGGGGLVVFCGENVRPDGYAALDEAGLGVGTIRGVDRAAEVPFRIARWEPGHPMLGPFDDPQHGNLRRLGFRAHTHIEPADEATVLATFDDDTPTVLVRDLGRGRVLWWTTACDSEWSDWTGSGLYVPLMHQTLRYLAGLAEGGPVRTIVVGRDANGDPVTRNDTAERDADTEPLVTPGVHERDGVWMVVNASPRESETERCTVEEFRERFGGRTGEEVEELPVAAAGVGRTRNLQLRDDEVWHWFIVVLMGVLCLESFVANRTAV